MNGMTRTELGLADLPRSERIGVYWSCYWRAVVYVAAQTVLMAPLVILFTYHSGPFKESESHIWRGIGMTEACSLAIGFGLVASFVRMVLRLRIGRLRFALVLDDASSHASEDA
jgi:hypothetical protein